MVSISDLSHQTAALLGHAVAAQATQAEALGGRGQPTHQTREDKHALDLRADAPALIGTRPVVPAALVATQESKDSKNDFSDHGNLSKEARQIVAAQVRQGKAEAEPRSEKADERRRDHQSRRQESTSLLDIGPDRPNDAYLEAGKRAKSLAAQALPAASKQGLILPGGPQGRSLLA